MKSMTVLIALFLLLCPAIALSEGKRMQDNEMGVIRVNYEADVLPEDASPPWSRSAAAGSTRTISAGILTVTNPPLVREGYTRSESPFTRGFLFVRTRFHVTDTLFTNAAELRGLGIQTLTPSKVRFWCGNLAATHYTDVAVDTTVLHDYEVKFNTISGGYPRAHLYVDGEYKATLTSPVRFTPERIRWRTAGGGSSDWDYLRYKLMGVTGRQQRLHLITPQEIQKEEAMQLRGEFGRYFTYPAGGGTKSLGVGDMTLDFEEGDVSLPNGKEDKISDQLGKGESVRAVFIDSPDNDVVIQMDSGGKYTCEANELTGFIFVNFKQLKVTMSATTAFKMFASTDPRGGIVKA